MSKEAADFQKDCMSCQESNDVHESLFVQEAIDWKQTYVDFLQHRLLPPNRSDTMKVKNKSSRFFVEDGFLFRRWFNQPPLRCIAGDGAARVIKEVHSGDCDEHQGGSRLFK